MAASRLFLYTHPTTRVSPAVEHETALALAIDALLSVPDFNNDHCAFFVLNCIDDAIPPLPHSVTIPASIVEFKDHLGTGMSQYLNRLRRSFVEQSDL